MNSTIDYIVCPKCDFASQVAGNFCSNCGTAFDSGTNSKAQSGNGFYRDEYGWQRGEPAGDPRYSPAAEAFWANHKVVEEEPYETGDLFTNLVSVIGVGFAIYGVCKLIEKASNNDKLLNQG